MAKYKRCIRFKCFKSRFGQGGPPRCKKRGYTPRCVSWEPLQGHQRRSRRR